jgi:hypothetical protein
LIADKQTKQLRHPGYKVLLNDKSKAGNTFLKPVAIRANPEQVDTPATTHLPENKVKSRAGGYTCDDAYARKQSQIPSRCLHPQQRICV